MSSSSSSSTFILSPLPRQRRDEGDVFFDEGNEGRLCFGSAVGEEFDFLEEEEEEEDYNAFKCTALNCSARLPTFASVSSSDSSMRRSTFV